MTGIILAGGLGTRLYPMTQSISKQLLPVFDKPMVYYPLSVLMLAGIQDIILISTPDHIKLYETLLGNGNNFGIKLKYIIQEKPSGIPEAFNLASNEIDSRGACLVLGDNIFHGPGFQAILNNCIEKVKNNKAVILTSTVTDPERYGIASMNNSGKVISIEEKPKKPKSNCAVTGLYFYPSDVIEKTKKLNPSQRGELEITDLNIEYLKESRLEAIHLGRGFAWLDTGTPSSLFAASQYVKVIQDRTSVMIACLEEIGIKKGFITANEVIKNIQSKKGFYYNYIRSFVGQ